MFNAIEVLASGMEVARKRVNVLASNIANAETTRTPEGGPYKRRDVVQVAKDLPGSFSSALDRMTLKKPAVAAITVDESAPRQVYQPGHPDADTQGFVAYPNINVVTTMSDMMTASRLYQASAAATETARQMQTEAGRILNPA